MENFLRCKSHYLTRGPLAGRDAVILWGAGQMGRRLAKHLARAGAPLVAHLDIDPGKIGRSLRGTPVLPVEALPDLWRRYQKPVLLSVVSSRGARQIIRARLAGWGLVEGEDYWCAA
ncbi:MAG: hypothetical protein HY784_07675 [Chloroflexi bacterium]|nr:hypothetical protein [Chloroflexota bacterium]